EKAAISAEQRTAIHAVRPDLAGAAMVLRADGWDCLAIEVDGLTVFKIPHHDAAIGRLCKEPATLDLIRPHTALALPKMRLHEAPILMTEHRKVLGEAVDEAAYGAMAGPVRAQLADDLARFFAAIHGVAPEAVWAADCDGLRPWPDGEALLKRLDGRVGPTTMAQAERTVAAHARHGPDEIVFGQFDTHGWNMAFDVRAGRLHGLFDFAGAGIGELHRDLSYPFFVSADLARQVVARYAAISGRDVDFARVADAHGYLRVIELCDELDGPEPVTRFEAALARYCDIRCTI
ncbi:MAG: phosphotransferase, partial [Pseudomonadota bacterium]